MRSTFRCFHHGQKEKVTSRIADPHGCSAERHRHESRLATLPTSAQPDRARCHAVAICISTGRPSYRLNCAVDGREGPAELFTARRMIGATSKSTTCCAVNNADSPICQRLIPRPEQHSRSEIAHRMLRRRVLTRRGIGCDSAWRRTTASNRHRLLLRRGDCAGSGEMTGWCRAPS